MILQLRRVDLSRTGKLSWASAVAQGINDHKLVAKTARIGKQCPAFAASGE
jgi:hypothetical protein